MRDVGRSALDDNLGVVVELDVARISFERLSVNGNLQLGSAPREERAGLVPVQRLLPDVEEISEPEKLVDRNFIVDQTIGGVRVQPIQTVVVDADVCRQDEALVSVIECEVLVDVNDGALHAFAADTVDGRGRGVVTGRGLTRNRRDHAASKRGDYQGYRSFHDRKRTAVSW